MPYELVWTNPDVIVPSPQRVAVRDQADGERRLGELIREHGGGGPHYPSTWQTGGEIRAADGTVITVSLVSWEQLATAVGNPSMAYDTRSYKAHYRDQAQRAILDAFNRKES